MSSIEREYIDDCMKTNPFASERVINEYPPGSPQEWQLRVRKDPSPDDTELDKWDGCINEVKRLAEEIEEAEEACEDENPLELLDAYCDIRFIFKNFENRLKKYGYDVDGAFRAVCLNNDLKYTRDKTLVEQWVKEISNAHPHYDFFINTSDCNDGTFYCVKRVGDDKVMKPLDHPKVDLRCYLPKGKTI